jgi:hypothetical protein
MTKMMDTLKSIIDFFAEYDAWAKVLMIAGLTITFGTMILAPRKKTVEEIPPDTPTVKTLENIFQEDPTKDELIAELYGDKQLLKNHLASSNYEDLLILNKINLENVNFDLVVYCHNDAMNQMGRPMLFIKFYDINTKDVDWEGIDGDWQSVSKNLTWNNIKSGLERVNGFKYSLEWSTPFGFEKPHLYYVQLVGRRDELKQFDIASMQNRRIREDFSPFHRVVGTYDFMIEKFRPLIN